MKIRIAITLCLLTLLISACASLGNLAIPEVVRGSGNVIEQSFDATDFSKLYIAANFAGTVQYGDAYNVTVRIDDNLMNDVRISVDDGVLNVLMARKNYQQVTERHVTITMPALEQISLHGVSHVAVEEFPRTATFVANIAGVSELSGVVLADDLEINVSGTGKAALSGSGETLTLTANSLSSADLSQLPVVTASVTLANASRANVTASQRIDIDASNNSELRYGGGATLGNTQLDATSTVSERQ